MPNLSQTLIQAMTKGAKMLEKERERKKQDGEMHHSMNVSNYISSIVKNLNNTFLAADARAAPGADMSISDGSSEISGVPKDREKKHDISNH